jgi:AcrR family transcriptional regulator
VIDQDFEGPQKSRSRFLKAGKNLFARNGYEQTSTATIAREAGSSESQLMRYFGGKAGLLEAILNDAWVDLNQQVQQEVDQAVHGRDAVLRVARLMIHSFSRDPEIAFLFVFESRRARGSSHEVAMSSGFLQFLQVVDSLIARGRADGSFRTDIEASVMSAAMLGCAEGMVRERIVADRNRQPNPFDDCAMLEALAAMVNGLAP